MKINAMNYRNSRGLSLIELMVAILLGVLLSTGMVQVFGAAKSQFYLQSSLAQLQEDGRFAVGFIAREIRTAGYRDEVWDTTVFSFPIAANSADGGGTGTDKIEIITLSNTDCFGAANTMVDAANDPLFYEKVSVFSVNASDDLIHDCKYGPTAATAVQQLNEQIVANVEQLQIQYGLDTSGDQSANRWVNGGNWLANGAAPLNQVVSVRIALLLATEGAVSRTNDTQTFNLFGTNIAAANDRKFRKLFSTTVNMRNLTL